MHAPIPVPTRITIDFREDVRPSRGWIIGAIPDGSGRIELLSLGSQASLSVGSQALPLGVTGSGRGLGPARPPEAETTAATADCACPAFCERDHENE